MVEVHMACMGIKMTLQFLVSITVVCMSRFVEGIGNLLGKCGVLNSL